MIIRSERELGLFEETLDKCQNTIWLISTCGTQYDLMIPRTSMVLKSAVLSFQSEILMFYLLCCQSRIFPSREMVITCHGINFPEACSAFCAAR